LTKFFKTMKKTTPLSIKIILVIFCVFSLGNTYSQDKKTTNKTIFGKTVKAPSVNPNNGKIRCVTTEYEQFLQEKNPKRMTNTEFETWLTPLVTKYKAIRTNSKTAGTVITIPVVVHVIHNGQALGVAPNITDAQVQSQITVLNQDYRKMLGTPGGASTNSIAADVQIEFALALQDPKGNPTNGIDRVSLNQESWSDIDIDGILKPATIWDPTLYLNMWSLKFTDNTLLGYAQFPDNNFDVSDPNYLGGLDPSGGAANTDGVVSSYDVFGSSDFGSTFLLAAPYDKGRTMTHEVGHFLGLRHIWGDGGSRDSGTKDCTATDYCADTPPAGWENYDCLTTYDSCPTDPGNDMIENYMDYTNDECMNIFTQNQKDRIIVIMNNAARRNTLKTSTKATAIPLFANDAEIKLEANYDLNICGATANQTTQKVTIYNRGTTNLTSATINYNINGGSNTVYNWTGSLASNKYATFDIIINSASNGTINASIVGANGGTDQRVTNNTASGTFIIPATPSNYIYTNYVFRLQQDLWGSETTWELKNGSGAIVYSGGPYTNKKTLPALITKNWTLDNSQCYTFTIYDSMGDGICCDGGNGFYDIKTNSGAIVVTSGSSFTTSASKNFTTNTLGTNKFEALNNVYLYPNPTKGTLNISIPSSFGLPNSYSISNSLGQIISRKKVSKETDLTVNTSTLSNGVYFITIAKEDQTKTLQFIKE
jgi:hypothetical protein